MADNWPVVGLLVGVTAVLLVTAGVVLAGPIGVFGTDGADLSAEPPPVPTPSDAPAAETGATNGQPFTLGTHEVEECGMLCRNVTSTVTNEQSTEARDVTVRTRLYAGNDTDGEIRWQRTELADRIGPGQTYRTTQRVQLQLEAALAIRDAGGWVTIRTRVQSADRTVTITHRREVI